MVHTLEAQEGRCHHDCQEIQPLLGGHGLLLILLNPGSLWARANLDGHLFQESLLCLAYQVVLENQGLLCHL